jgi:DNA-binding SARP family transcriptional activator/tetratricopeptide (TPR) repeat protein
VRFEVLGPLRVVTARAGEPVLVSASRLRVVLAVLLWRASQPVTVDELSEMAWDGAPPPGAAATMRGLILRLRRALGPQAGARIVTRAPGYLIELAGDELDASWFVALGQRTGDAIRAGDWLAACATAEQAMALWRGAALLDVPCQALREAWLPRLDQHHIQVRQWHAEAGLHLGQHERLIPALTDLTTRHPLNEHFHAQLMTALARSGRQAEALQAYRDARRVLVNELGIEPGPGLRAVHQRILSGQGESAAALPGQGEGSAPRTAAAPVVPRQLPAAPGHFTGRERELDRLAVIAGGAGAQAGTVVISAIDGMAGIGKTALAVHAAHRLAGRFPDGQLFLDLHGYTQGYPPRTASGALEWLLQALGVPPEGIPADGEQAAALYRQRLAGTRTLIVLDNAAHEAQVRPLLPGGGSCLVLVTSRRRLKALDDAQLVSLDLLSPPAAVALLRAVAGPGRIPAGDPLAGEVAGLCGYLPLALRIAASLLRHRPAWSVEHLAGQLRDQDQRVSALSDGERELPAVFDLSYASLQAPHRRLWRLLGLIPGPDLDAYAAAALAEADPAHAAGLLEDLVDHNLLAACAPGRYRLHDLLRAHARTLAAADPALEREAAVDRLLHYYAHTAQSPSVPIARYPRPAPGGPAPARTPALPGPKAARTWLRTEQPSLEAALTHARTHGLDGHALALAALPLGPRHFAGREAELAVLTRLLADVGAPGGAVVISAIGGTAGIGKTALAVHWAHHVADRFPDGQLYVNLRGYDPEESMSAADALAGFLRALGVPGHDIPPEAEERAARYRTLVAGRRMLVVLDNARQVEQVRPLLPGGSGCAAVVTSRDALAGLVARDGAVRLDLDLLPLADAVGLLRALIGPRVDADLDTADTLAKRCARLPLALRIAAELAVGRPAASLAELAGELADQQQRLDLLDAGGDPRTAVRAVFSWSYRHLDSAAARAFRMLSMHTGTDLDRYAAAALMGTAVERTGRLVRQLSSANLLQPTGAGRHAMHDLLRAYGRELAAADRGDDERRAALTRLFDYYLRTSAAAMNTLFPAEAADRPTIPGPAATVMPTTDNRGTARAWLDAERRNYVAAAAHAAAQGWPGHATRMAATVFRYLDVGGHMSEAVTIHSHARRAATVIGDHAAEAEALTCLGVAYLRQSLFDQAAGHLHQALRLCRQTGDRGGEARALVDLGLVDLRQGKHERGRGSLQLGAGVYRDIGDRFGEARAMANLGIVERRLGRYRQASECLLQSLAVCQAAGDRLSQAPVLTNLGLVDLELGRYQQAVGHHRQALAIFRETGNPNGEAHALSNLGVAELRWQRYEHAAGHLRQARTLFRETGDTAGEAEALNGLGELLLATGQPSDARAQHAAALVLTGQIGDKYEQARAHDGLARCYHAADDPGRTVRHWQEALALYSYLRAPEAEQVRAHLTAAHDR